MHALPDLSVASAVPEPIPPSPPADDADEAREPRLGDLFDLLAGRPLPLERGRPALSSRLAIRAGGASLVFCSLFGLAAGVDDLTLLVLDPVKVPVVAVAATACALPPGLLVWKVAGAGPVSDLLASYATGLFTASLVLACGAPLVALYSLTTRAAGGPLAMTLVGVALAFGVLNALRATFHRSPDGANALTALLPMGAMLGVLLVALVQVIALFSPILPEDTWLDHGVDGLLEQL